MILTTKTRRHEVKTKKMERIKSFLCRGALVVKGVFLDSRLRGNDMREAGMTESGAGITSGSEDVAYGDNAGI
jgi:hypothetical protein